MTDLFSSTSIENEPERRGRALLVVVGSLVLVLLLAFFGGRAVFGRFGGSAPDYDGPGSGEVVAQVTRGDSASAIGGRLAALDVVKSAKAFRAVASDDERSRGIQPGYYRMRSKMSARAALDRLLDPAARIRSRYTIPEGSTVAKTLQIISKSVEKMPLADLQAAVAKSAALGLPDYARGRVEGFLFPATYDVEPGTSAVEVLQAMVRRFALAAEAHSLVESARAVGRTPHEVLVLASLIEGEAGTATDRGKVARVAYNRLKQGMRLEFDATIKYAFALRGETKTRILLRDLEIDSPYNTYRRTGLPPTPISSPGDAAIRAALEPTPGPWLYFVVIDKQGNSAFTASYEEFLRLKARYQRDVLGR